MIEKKKPKPLENNKKGEQKSEKLLTSGEQCVTTVPTQIEQWNKMEASLVYYMSLYKKHKDAIQAKGRKNKERIE